MPVILSLLITLTALTKYKYNIEKERTIKKKSEIDIEGRQYRWHLFWLWFIIANAEYIRLIHWRNWKYTSENVLWTNLLLRESELWKVLPDSKKVKYEVELEDNQVDLSTLF